jgi:hypothetical protein
LNAIGVDLLELDQIMTGLLVTRQQKDKTMNNDRDPYYVTRCIGAAAHTRWRWIVDAGLVAILLTALSLAATPSGVSIDEQENDILLIARMRPRDIQSIGTTEPVFADIVIKSFAKSRC